MAAIIGIDLGTTYSAVATLDATGRPVIVHNGDGANLTPSCIEFRDDGVAEVGEFARRSMFLSGSGAIGRFKREMGTSQTFVVKGRTLTPTQLSALVLKRLVADATRALGEIGEAVVTIPANFSHEAREATMAAASAAGLRVRFIINEPTAAALYYAFHQGKDLGGIYAVYDLGGGTFDISVIRVDGSKVEVLASNGVAKLGGDDFDRRLQSLVAKKYAALTGEELHPDDFTLNDAEAEKRALSHRERVSVRVSRKLIEITRGEFEEAISSLVSQAEMLCEATLDDAGVHLDDIQEVLLVGGSTRIPAIQNSVQRLFRRQPQFASNVDEMVALGAALYAGLKGDRTMLSPGQRNALEGLRVQESTGRCFGTLSLSQNEHNDRVALVNNVLIRKGEKIPCSRSETFYTVNVDQRAVRCSVTESIAPEQDPRFVTVVWEGSLALPPGRPEGQPVEVSFAYDENQIMKCSFRDVGTGRLETVDLTMAQGDQSPDEGIDRFLVE